MTIEIYRKRLETMLTYISENIELPEGLVEGVKKFLEEGLDNHKNEIEAVTKKCIAILEKKYTAKKKVLEISSYFYSLSKMSKFDKSFNYGLVEGYLDDEIVAQLPIVIGQCSKILKGE